MDWTDFEQAARDLGYALTRRELDGLATYQRLLAEGAQGIALTTITDVADFLRLHALDALTLVRALPPGPAPTTIADIGSGAGLPAIPLALCLSAHDRFAGAAPRVLAIESVRKKTTFMTEVAASLGLEDRFEACPHRAEEIGRDPAHREAHDLVTARALAPLPVLLELGVPLLRPQGWLIAWKGPRADEEIAAAANALEVLHCEVEAVVPGEIPGRDHRLLRIRKLAPTPAKYPRRPGMPKKRPL